MGRSLLDFEGVSSFVSELYFGKRKGAVRANDREFSGDVVQHYVNDISQRNPRAGRIRAAQQIERRLNKSASLLRMKVKGA
jgi:hypothetical protein